MQLDFAPVRNRFEVFPGSIQEQMPILLADRRKPASIEDILTFRKLAFDALSAATTEDEELLKQVLSNWEDKYYDTVSATVYHPEGNIKIVPVSHDLRAITSQTPLSQGGFVLGGVEDRDASVARYNAVDAAEFTRADIQTYGGKQLRRQEAKNNPFWKALIPDDATRNDLVDHTFNRLSTRFNYETGMGLWLSQKPTDVALGRAWMLININYLSDAYDGDLVNFDYGRLVGEATESLLGSPEAVRKKFLLHTSDKF